MRDLRLVEIELFNYCNRKCKWCPNSFIDRKSECLEIDDEVLDGALLELKNNNYTNPITFSRYNEPLAKLDILNSKLKQIKAILPHNKLVTNTNGDFLEQIDFDTFLIDELTIMDYDNKGLHSCLHRLVNLDVDIKRVEYPYIYGIKSNTEILYVVDWTRIRNITDRGGSLKEYSKHIRTKKCLEPTYFVGINYDGTVSPCCNIRNDIEEHKKYIIGDLHHNSLREVLSSRKAKEFRKQCAEGNFQVNSPCYFCENSGGRYTRGGAGIFYE